jgi:hypothetical protein
MAHVAETVAAMSGGLYVAAFAPSLHVNKNGHSKFQQPHAFGSLPSPSPQPQLSADVLPFKHLDRELSTSFRMPYQIEIQALEYLFRKSSIQSANLSINSENRTMVPNPDTSPTQPSPGLLRYVLGFLLVGAAWGLTTPFMRRAALASTSSPSKTSPSTPDSRSWLTHPSTPYLKAKIWSLLYSIYDTLKNPAYAIPFLINVTGSVWFFLLIGQAELSLTVPITNSLAFLFTVLGEWWVEGKGIARGEFCIEFLWGSEADFDWDRYLGGYGVGAWWDWALCAFEEYLIARPSMKSIVLAR